MARQKVSRYKKRDSDRSGFTYLEQELIYDKGVLVGPDEFDTPPPSDKNLGGEGEVSEGDVRSDPTSYETPSENNYSTYIVDSSNSINFVRKTYSGGETTNYGLVYIAATDSQTEMAVNPQISRANQGDIITLLLTSNHLVIYNGSGLSLYSSHYRMESGSLITLVYNTGNNVWQEISRGHQYKSIGAF